MRLRTVSKGYESPRPLNSLPAPGFPTSAARRVRAKSRGYTKQRDVAPAAPPEARFPAKYLQNWAKFRAWVGKYLMTLARLPLQKEMKPCSLGMRTMQSMMPLYCISAEKLHPLDGSDGCLGDGGGDAASQEVLGERYSCLIHVSVFLVCLSDDQ
ncbi:hypothetical protein EYF80_034852 [Liparis tanakae]|uniref:Uncharacterized protein n=1 Tax=Liparis tanakae TaxID=230148 RepID=A0A4Z2GMX6_9TELE|nr:hypothetical protein EYF80_034852 [Liparis tanakae]